MPAKDLGVKHTCWKCGTKFYDLKKADAVCPKCGADPRAQPTAKAAAATERRRPAREAPVEEVATDPLEDAEVDEDLAEDGADEPEEQADDEG